MPLTIDPIPDPTVNDIDLYIRRENDILHVTISYRGRTESVAAPLLLSGTQIPAGPQSTIDTLLSQARAAYMNARGF